MSTKLGTLTLDLVAKVGSFVGPIKDAEKQTKTSFDNMRKNVNLYGAAVLGLAASGVTALAGMAYSTAQQATELEKFAFRANTTTQEFQKMAAGAGAFGIEQEKLSDMMKDFNEKLGELTTIGAGGGVDFFEQIAMKTEGGAEGAKKLILEMQKLSGPDALQLYVKKLEEAGVSHQQMSFYLESMASDLTDLYPLLANGGEGLKLYGDMAERAGIIMTDQTVESAKLLKDQVYMLDLQMQGAKNQLMQAVIPAFVDIAEAFFGGSEQGLQFEKVAEGIAKTLKALAAVAIGAVTAIQLVGKALGGMAAIGGAIWNEMDWYEMNPLGVAKAAYEARGEIAALTKEIKGDMHETVMGAADRLDKMWSSGSSKKAEQLRGIRELSQTIGGNKGVNDGLGELAGKQDKAAKSAKSNAKATSDAAKAQREYNQAVELGKRLIYEYGDEQLRIAKDLENDLEDIRSASLKQEAKGRYSEVAKLQAEARKKAYFAELEDELFGHRKTEEDKLKDELNINKLRLDAQRGLNKNELDLRKAALEDKARLELSYIQADKLARADSAMAAWGGTYSDMTGTGDQFGIESEKFNRFDQSQELFDAQIALAESAEQREAIWQAHHERMTAIELSYNESKRALAMASAGDMLGNMTDLMGSLLGEQSAGYKAMFGIQKAFAIAQILLNAPESYSKAFNSMVGIPLVGPVLAPIAGGVAIATQLAQLATVKSVSLSGMAHDGIDNIPKEGTWLLDKGERVVDARTNGDLKDFIANNNNGPKVIINVPPGHTAKQNVGVDGTVTIDVVRQEIAGAFNSVRRPNSTESRVFQDTFGLSPSR
ncbi:hypothetical protein [Acinetobacter sp. YH12029]|uniref:hypothetical protein n=1 Tax=Acinetobacter sp. YH12029 TaxID=2601044 RepID=UPI0015D44A1C|nr:hypothetical protein [Acinetobacter sp. YH12029]